MLLILIEFSIQFVQKKMWMGKFAIAAKHVKSTNFCIQSILCVDPVAIIFQRRQSCEEICISVKKGFCSTL